MPRIRTSLLLALIICGSVSTLFGQFQEEWTGMYSGGPGSFNYPADVTIDEDGNTYVVQTIYISGSANMVLVKFNPSGDTLWTRSYDGPGNASDVASAIALDKDGNVYIGGTTTPSGETSNLVTAKYAPDGTLLWAARYDTTGENDRVNSIAVDDSGNVYAAGSRRDKFFVAKIDKDGNLLWATPSDPDANYPLGTARHIALDNNGNVYATGESGQHIHTAKYTAAGDTVWTRLYYRSLNPGQNALANTLAVDKDGNAIVGGSASDENDADFALLKYTPTGTLAWARHHDGPQGLNDAINDLGLDDNGNVYVTGETTDSSGAFTATTLKYSPAGDSLWLHTYNGDDLAARGAFGNSQLLISDARTWRIFVISNMIFLYGQRYDFAAAAYGLWVMAVTLSGIETIWALTTLPGSHLYCATFFARATFLVGTVLHIAILASMWSNSSGPAASEMWVRMYELSTTGVEPIDGVGPEKFALHQNYPNPFNPSTKISFSLPEAAEVSLRVFDALGREVAELVRGRLAAGSYESAFDAGSFGTGMYFYRLRAGNHTETRRMMLVK